MNGLSGKAVYLAIAALVLVALLVLAVYWAAGSSPEEKEPISINQPSPGEGGGKESAKQPASKQQGEPEVVLEFLYADWCPHCQKMKPIVQKIAGEMPSERLKIVYWRDEDVQKDRATYDRFSYYRQKGIFVGFPTFVINNGEDYLAGEVSEPYFRDWLCRHFSSPKPEKCNS
ncbi:MAG: thioredoxin family protein [Candidatus Micrarchaeota archaeon]|nr:thioredoxin family protein [Candidatus Micrarchaeota archaeon]